MHKAMLIALALAGFSAQMKAETVVYTSSATWSVLTNGAAYESSFLFPVNELPAGSVVTAASLYLRQLTTINYGSLTGTVTCPPRISLGRWGSTGEYCTQSGNNYFMNNLYVLLSLPSGRTFLGDWGTYDYFGPQVDPVADYLRTPTEVMALSLRVSMMSTWNSYAFPDLPINKVAPYSATGSGNLELSLTYTPGEPIVVTHAPEPGFFLIVGLGLVGLVAVRRFSSR